MTPIKWFPPRISNMYLCPTVYHPPTHHTHPPPTCSLGTPRVWNNGSIGPLPILLCLSSRVKMYKVRHAPQVKPGLPCV